jgi:hypothetical protein
MLGLSISSLVAWLALEILRVSFAEVHLLLLVAAGAYLIHLTRTRGLAERSQLPARNREALRAARHSRKRLRRQRVLEVAEPDELDALDTGRWRAPDAGGDANGFVPARGSRMTVLDVATRDAILDALSEMEVASITTASTISGLHAGDEFIDLEHVELGVRRASGVAPPPGYVLPRCAVSDATWRLVVSMLDLPISENT